MPRYGTRFQLPLPLSRRQNSVLRRVRVCTLINYLPFASVVTAIAITIVEQQIDNGDVSMCSSHHRLKHWPADDGCNECKCAKSVAGDVDDKTTLSSQLVSCTNLWCGPATYDCLSRITPCTGTNQVTYSPYIITRLQRGIIYCM